MPTTIPYDPKLVLANIVDEKHLVALKALADAQKPIDDAEESFNSLLQAKYSLDMIIQELASMEIGSKDESKDGAKDSAKDDSLNDMNQQVEGLKNEIREQAIALAKLKFEAYKAGGSIAEAKKSVSGLVNFNVESPVDYGKTQFKTMPLSADSLKMDAQYFSFDENEENAKNTIKNIGDYVAGAFSFWGNKASAEASEASQQQINSQRQNHDLQGTLVITASCTHKNALLLEPLVLDVDKAVRVWNKLYPSDKILLDNVEEVVKIAKTSDTDKESTSDTEIESAINILSGATFGSSFVGMVHLVRSEATKTDQEMQSLAGSLQAQVNLGGWFEDAKGGFGLSETTASDIKNLLSEQKILTHASIITMGSIPSIKSNEVKIGVKEFADFDPAKMMDKLATLANATQKDHDTVAAGGAAARTGEKMVQIRGAEVKSVMAGLADIDDGRNKILDINSVMTAFEDYVNKALAGNIGVPINYYIKPIAKSQLAELWIKKYHPQELDSSNKNESEKEEKEEDKGGGKNDDKKGKGGGKNDDKKK